MSTGCVDRVRKSLVAIGLLALVSGCAASISPTAQPGVQPAPKTTVHAAGSCSSESLASILQDVTKAGQPVVVGHVALTGEVKQRAAADPSQLGLVQTYTEVALTEVRSVNGVAVSDGLSAYVLGGRSDDTVTVTDPPLQSAWNADGMFFGYITADGAVGPVLSATPLDVQNIVFTSAGCWNTEGLAVQPVQANIVTLTGLATTTTTAKFPSVPLDSVTGLLNK